MPHSARPTLQQVRAVFQVLSDGRDLRHDPAASRAQMVSGMCKLLGARQGTMLRLEGFQLGKKMKLVDAAHGGWANPAAVALWEGALRSQQFEQDVLLSRSREIDAENPAGGRAVAMLRDEIVPDEVFYGAPLIREIIPLIEIDSHVCGWQTPTDGGPTLGMTFHRVLGSKPFTPREREMLRLFMDELALLQAQGKLTSSANGTSPIKPPLSPREREVVQHLVVGRSVKQAAGIMLLTRRTVEGYVKTVYRKYEVHSRAELLGKVLRSNGQ